MSQSEYLIDRHRVIFDSGIGWHCVCLEFIKLSDCKHTRESAGRRTAQDLIKNRGQPSHGTLAMFSNRATDPHSS